MSQDEAILASRIKDECPVSYERAGFFIAHCRPIFDIKTDRYRGKA